MKVEFTKKKTEEEIRQDIMPVVNKVKEEIKDLKWRK